MGARRGREDEGALGDVEKRTKYLVFVDMKQACGWVVVNSTRSVWLHLRAC